MLETWRTQNSSPALLLLPGMILSSLINYWKSPISSVSPGGSFQSLNSRLHSSKSRCTSGLGFFLSRMSLAVIDKFNIKAFLFLPSFNFFHGDFSTLLSTVPKPVSNRESPWHSWGWNFCRQHRKPMGPLIHCGPVILIDFLELADLIQSPISSTNQLWVIVT